MTARIPALREGSSRRERAAKPDEHSQHKCRLAKQGEAVAGFARDPDAGFANTAAERAIQMSKVKAKVFGCLRTPGRRRSAAAAAAALHPGLPWLDEGV